MKTIASSLIVSAALLATGGAMAQQANPQQPRIEGVPAMTAPMRSSHGSEHSRADVRTEARHANALGEADKGGRVASDLGRQDGADPFTSPLTRAEVQAQVRGSTDRIGGEADDLGNPAAM